ncbi:MAG: hypothetical protein JJ931_14610 [Henriciella sp.]|nr:hypothetical protein [Henriciella sp.]
MLLRRITKHVKDQNWLAVGIDFVIVVIGVFVGLQVNTWNERQSTNHLSAEFSERLIADLREEAWNFQLMVEYYDDVLTHAYKALAILEGEQEASDEALLISAYRATQYQEVYRRRATYDELTSTGTMSLIRDQELRTSAVRIYSVPIFANLTSEGMNSRYRVAFRMALPLNVQNALTEHCGDKIILIGDFESIVNMLDYECKTELAPEVLAEAASTLRSHDMLIALLRLRTLNIESDLSALLTSNTEVRAGFETFFEGSP